MALSSPFGEALGPGLASFPDLFLFNSSLQQFEETSLVFLFGSDLRKENPLLHLRLRRNYLKRLGTELPLKVFSIGPGCAYENLPVTQVGASVETIQRL